MKTCKLSATSKIHLVNESRTYATVCGRPIGQAEIGTSDSFDGEDCCTSCWYKQRLREQQLSANV